MLADTRFNGLKEISIDGFKNSEENLIWQGRRRVFSRGMHRQLSKDILSYNIERAEGRTDRRWCLEVSSK